MPPDLTPERLLDWDAIVEWLAGVTPLCPPGERSMYHSLSFGYLLGEVLRRTDPGGRPFDQVVRDELTQPFGIDDVWFGVPPEHEHRIAQLTWGAEPPSEPHVKPNPIRAMMMPAGVDPGPGPWNTRAAHAACVPAAGGIMTARAGARFMAVLANGGVLDGVRLASEERLRACARLRPNPDQIDEGIGRSTTNGVGGYFVGGPNNRPGTLAAGGAGGSVAWADLDARVGVAITHNRMFADLPEHPFAALIAAVNDITGVQAGAAGGAS
jgi:CubicO group peptidase (beta-lactamase class C family)